MKKSLFVIAMSITMMGCATTTHVKLPKDSVLKLKGDQQVYKEGELVRNPMFWTAAGGIPYTIEKNGSVIRNGKMRAKFRPVSIFWPPAAAIYWPMGFRFGCNDLTGKTPTEC